jgi:hypothetical protein
MAFAPVFLLLSTLREFWTKLQGSYGGAHKASGISVGTNKSNDALQSTARQIDTGKMSVWDIRLKEAIPFPSDRVSRVKRIESAAPFCCNVGRA